jgi:predicted transcriptional regulator
MNIQSDKLEIIQWLARINDTKIVKQFVLLKRLNEEQTSVSIKTEEKHAIDEGLKSIKDGRTKSHEEVTQATQKKYPQLFK